MDARLKEKWEVKGRADILTHDGYFLGAVATTGIAEHIVKTHNAHAELVQMVKGCLCVMRVHSVGCLSQEAAQKLLDKFDL